MIQFTADKKPLTFLLDQIDNRDLALPDFQRSFVWDPGATRELVASIVRSFPAGTLLLMQGGAEVFAPRAVEHAPALIGKPSFLILDGQQRMTSLYQAFSGSGTHCYFLNLQELLEGFDVDEAVEVYNTKRAKRWETTEAQAKSLMLPLRRLRDFNDWRDDVLEAREQAGDDAKKLKKALNELEKEYVKPVELYQFPVTTLSDATPVEAICTIFETLNRTGVKLSVFELLTARAFAHDVQLRDMWDAARKTNPVLSDFEVDPYYVLQVIAVWVSGTPKRSAVLKLSIDDITHHWNEAINGMARGLELLRDECGVLTPKWLGYQTMLLTLAASWRKAAQATGPAVGDRRAKLKRWFWCSAFAGAYENAPNTTTEQDVPALEAWLAGNGEPPGLVRDFTFSADRWRGISYRQRALYRSTIALLMSRTPLDFHEGKKLDKAVIDGEKVDDHHVFPRGYLADTSQTGPIDSVLNHTLIDKKTNIRIGKKAPSVYLTEIADELGEALMAKILDSHCLPSGADGPLRGNSFEAFLTWRLERLAALLGDVSGGTVHIAASAEDADAEILEFGRELPYAEQEGAGSQS